MRRIKKIKPGPKRIFTSEMLRQVEFLSRLGATNSELAEFFGKCESTIDNWIKDSRLFRTARRNGGIVADAKVVDSLFKRANGFHFIEQKVLLVKTGKSGKKRKPVKMNVMKYQIPDTSACKYWLSNRRRVNWTDVGRMMVDHRHTGTVNHKHKEVEEIPIEKLSKNTKKMLFEVIQEQIDDGIHNN